MITLPSARRESAHSLCGWKYDGLLSSVEAFVAEFGPHKVHLAVVILDECLDLTNFAVTKDTWTLKNRVAVLFDEKLSGSLLGKLAITGMHVHALDDTVAGEVQVVAADLEVEVFRHD